MKDWTVFLCHQQVSTFTFSSLLGNNARENISAGNAFSVGDAGTEQPPSRTGPATRQSSQDDPGFRVFPVECKESEKLRLPQTVSCS